MKTCNGGYCAYKTLDGINQRCTYEGYCDYQCPKDSRNFGYNAIQSNSLCSCTSTTKDGSCIICGKKKE